MQEMQCLDKRYYLYLYIVIVGALQGVWGRLFIVRPHIYWAVVLW